MKIPVKVNMCVNSDFPLRNVMNVKGKNAILPNVAILLRTKRMRS